MRTSAPSRASLASITIATNVTPVTLQSVLNVLPTLSLRWSTTAVFARVAILKPERPVIDAVSLVQAV